MRHVLLALLLAAAGPRAASAQPPRVKARGPARAKAAADASPELKAREALAVIDGTTWVDHGPTPDARIPEHRSRTPGPGARAERTRAGGARAERTRAGDARAERTRAGDARADRTRTDDARTRADARRRADDARRRADEDRRDARAIARGLQPWRATILDRGGTRAGAIGAGTRGEATGAGTRGDAGDLEGAAQLVPDTGYYIRRPTRAYGEPYVVEYLRRAVAEVRALYPDVPTLAIGDLSAEHGGSLAGHVSHRTGRDVDVGFYFHHAATGFETAGGDLDLEATWALLAAFARTADRPDGVQMIFLDYAVQKRLYEFAKARGTPDDELAFMFQYPAGKDAMTGLVRHWPNHANHLHVRFKAAASR